MDPAMTKMIASGLIGLVVGLGIGLAIKCGGSKKGGAAKKPQPKKDRGEVRKTHPAPADGSVEIYVGNLSYEMSEEQLRKEFEAYGKVNSARLIINRMNGKSKGIIRNVILGLVGGAVGGYIGNLLGIGGGWVTGIILSIAGACLVVWIVKKLFA